MTFPIKRPPSKTSTLSQLAFPSNKPFTINRLDWISPLMRPCFPMVTILSESTFPTISPSICNRVWQVKIPSTFAPLAMMVVSEVDTVR